MSEIDPRAAAEQQSATQKIRHILAWLDSPRANRLSDEFADQLQYLQALSLCPATPQQRTAALDAFYNRILATTEDLIPTLTEHLPPLPRKHKTLLRNAQETLLAFAQALLNSIDAVNTHLVRGLGQPTETILWRAAHMLYRHYLLSALIAAPAGREIWLELHRTFTLAQNLKLTDLRPGPGGQTLLDAYLTPILLACALPTSLNAREVLFVAHYLSLTSELADPPEETVSGFLIDPGRDAPCQPADRKKSASADPDVRLAFSFKRLSARILTEASALANGIAPEHLGLPEFAGTASGRHLLRRLSDRWRTPAKRRFPRRRQGYRCQIIGGLPALTELFRSPDTPPLPEAQWMIINESPDGYAVMHVTGDMGQLAVGDIAALRSETGTHWQICVVRWVQSAHSEHFEAGLQILAGSAKTATLIPCNQGLEPPRYTVLLLPAVPHLHDLQTVIAPGDSLPDEPSRFLLLIESEKIEIREMCSTVLDERNEHFAAFSIQDDENELSSLADAQPH